MAEQNRFIVLNSIDVNEKKEQKNSLDYLSWAWAWAELKKKFPDSYTTVYERADGVNYFTDGKTCWVKTGVTLVDGDYSLEHIEYLPVMDFKNKSIPLENVTSMDVNKAIQRSTVKAIARHGIGLYIYAGEDLPEETEEQKQSLENSLLELNSLIGTLCKGMDKDGKVEFAKTHIVPILGTMNFKACRDADKMGKLVEHLKTLVA